MTDQENGIASHNMQSPLSLESILSDLHKEIADLREVRTRNGEMLVRIDVRVETLTKRLEDMKLDIDKEIDEIRREMVTKAEFKPVRNWTYGMIAIIGSGVLVAILALVLS